MSKRRNSIWWQSPRKATDIIKDRRISFLELFYDLAYVGYISQITHSLTESPTLLSLSRYLLLFFIGWWSWLNGSQYHDIHGNDDVRTRVFTFLQLIGIVAMAIFSHTAFTEPAGYIISYTFFQLLLAYLWYQTSVTDRHHRRFSLPYSICFLLAAIIFLSSLFFDSTYHVVIWLISLIVSMGVFLFIIIYRSRKVGFADAYTFKITESFKERIGLFTIIVIGEIILGIIVTATGIHHLSLVNLLAALFSTTLGIFVWWLYFDYISRRLPKRKLPHQFIWLLGQIPILVGINIIGACAATFVKYESIVFSSEFNNLFIGAAILFIAGVSLTWHILDKSNEILDYKIFLPLNALGILALIILRVVNISGIVLLVCANLIIGVITIITFIRGLRIYKNDNPSPNNGSKE